MRREVVRAIGWGLLVTVVLVMLILVGSRNLAHFDAALVAYTFASLFAAFGITYRYAMWLQRPPTALYFRRGWQVFLDPRWLGRNLVVWLQRLVRGFALNDFIWRRGRMRWGAHWLIMWGCVIAAAITFPLVFGWIHFDTIGSDFDRYRVYVFGFPTIAFHTHSLLGFFLFHGLVWASLLVIPGVMLAMRRRMRDRGAAAVQQFGEDILPLLALFAISVTGLLLWVSYEWLHGYAFDFLAILHAITVIFTLLWLPFGKFFHIFQRPAQLGVSFYKDAGQHGEQAHCARCGEAYASQLHVDDLITVERELGYRYEMNGATGADHYQRICPKCRRALLGLAQGRLMRGYQRKPTTTAGQVGGDTVRG
ncbi:MAG: MFS transporter [Phycisphaeraceae bacterium]